VREFELAGQVAVVTGAAQGIGEAVARRLGAAGARVVVADVQGEKAETVAAGIRAGGGDARAEAVDISSKESVAELSSRVAAAYGRTAILVNNAAFIPMGPLLEMDVAVWDRTIATNLSGSFYVSRAFVDDMIDGGGGSIVIISSVNGLRAQAGLSAYNVSKAGLLMLAQTLAVELARYSIRVNAIAPGDIDTQVAAVVADRAAAEANVPLGRFGRPEEVAEMALFLGSARSSYTTGGVFTVDGGLNAQLYPDNVGLGSAT
jgi:NAD(P)-dependent dehydrogenase (short-subunit alcohol dehydrogenase family)